MEYLAKVRDGSEDGKIVNGYWTLQITGAHLGENSVLPLYQELFSHHAPGFKSENNQIIHAMEMVSKHCQNEGIWVIDRGGDREVLFNHMLNEKNKKRFVIRLVGTRDLVHNKRQQNATKLAYGCSTPYTDTIVREKDGKEKVYHINYGYMPVKLPGHNEQLYMLVVKGYGEKPLMLLTTEPLRRNREVLYRLLGYYLKRWSIEETIRFVKQTYDLENIRVLSYTSLRNMMALLLAVFYFLAVILDTSQKLKVMANHVFKQAKRVFGIPDFKYYALGDGISALFKRAPGIIQRKTEPEHPPGQIALI